MINSADITINTTSEHRPTLQQSTAIPGVQALGALQGFIEFVFLGGGGDGLAFLLRILLLLAGDVRIRQETWPSLHISSDP